MGKTQVAAGVDIHGKSCVTKRTQCKVRAAADSHPAENEWGPITQNAVAGAPATWACMADSGQAGGFLVKQEKASGVFLSEAVGTGQPEVGCRKQDSLCDRFWGHI